MWDMAEWRDWITSFLMISVMEASTAHTAATQKWALGWPQAGLVAEAYQTRAFTVTKTCPIHGPVCMGTDCVYGT